MPSILLVSTFDMGRQPFGLASPAAWLLDAGADVVCVDLAKERLLEDVVRRSDVVAFFLPMHTATRLALPVIDRVRAWNPGARLAAYGLYAPLNEALLRARGVTEVLGGEFEADLVRVCMPAPDGVAADAEARSVVGAAARPEIPRLQFRVPVRTGLLPLTRYATLQVGDERRVAGYTEASRGCKHRCRHCPIVPVYDGRFRVVSADVVLADVRAQVEAGARHITFGDPDFFNGIRHAEAIVRGFAREFPGLTYDVTIKIEHLLQHAAMLPSLRDTGCAFVTSAVESLDDHVLSLLDKGHTRQDFFDVASLCRETRLTLAPTFVPFHPWTTIENYCDLLDTLERLDLVDHVAPIQLAIRLLVPEGSRLLELDDMRERAGAFDATTLTYKWTHTDPRVDQLQRDVAATVGRRLVSERRTVFEEITTMAHERAGLPRAAAPRASEGQSVPYRDEPWYCCAEPNPEQLTLV